jgi:hypothetical protein
MEEKRHPARKQALPESEAELLSTLFDKEFYTRVRQLFEAGWSLQSIGNACNPVRRRSTVKFWVARNHEHSPVTTPIPTPKLKTGPRGYVSRRPVSPGISGADRSRIEQLSPLARRYRSKMTPNSPQALANDELTIICTRLYESNVPVRELAEVAGVTYRAMARRLGK